MIEISEDNTEKIIQNFVFKWFKLFSEDKISDAIKLIDKPNCYGINWTEEEIKNLIENETYGPGTIFQKEHPEGIVYSDPDMVPIPEYEISELILYRDGSGYYYEHDFPLNGEWSDLTAQFEFMKSGSKYFVILHDLHIM